MRTHLAFGKAIVAALALAMATLALGTGSRAQDAAVAISVKNHHFQPAEVRAPANRRLAITVKNLDTTAMEFESVSLRVEKVIAASSEGRRQHSSAGAGALRILRRFPPGDAGRSGGAMTRRVRGRRRNPCSP